MIDWKKEEEKTMHIAFAQMKKANCRFYEEYRECEYCGEGGELFWFATDSKHFWATGTDEDNWDWACACDHCGYLARFSKAHGKLKDRATNVVGIYQLRNQRELRKLK
jgi:hypothetical protein